MNLNERIKNYRNENNLTQESLAKKLFVSRSSIAKWEQSRGFPSLDILSRLAQLMDVTLDDLVGEKEIKTLTLENSSKIKRNFFVVKITMIAVLIALILSSIVLAIILKDSKKEEEAPIVVGHVIFAEITEMVAGNGMSVLTSDQSIISFNGIDMSVDIFSRYGNTITYEDLKVGYYVRLAYANKELPTNSIENLAKIEVIEDYIDDYEVYGFLATTIEGDSPLNSNSAYLKHRYFLYGNSKESHSMSRWSYELRPKIEYGSQVITDADGNEYKITSSQDTFNTITVDRATFKNIWIYVIDNSETGYYLHGKFTYNNLTATNEYIKFNGNIVNENKKKAKNYELPYSIAVNYYISIELVYTNTITIYEYDKENILIKEQTFSSYEEYEETGNPKSEYFTDKNTLYVIIKIECANKSTTTSLLGIDEKTKFTLSNYLGYVFEINPKICNKS